MSVPAPPAGGASGQGHAPRGSGSSVLGPGESFVFAVAAMDHGHIGGQVNGLEEAGGTLKWVYDPPGEGKDPAAAARFAAERGARVASSLGEVLSDPEVVLVAAAAVPDIRAALGVACMRAGKHYFTDKAALTTLDQLAGVRAAVAETGRRFFVYYAERLHVECAVRAGELIDAGAIGRVVSVTGFGPHRLGPAGSRPAWFYDRARYGGILCDIGSHQIEQFLHYAGCRDARVASARVANAANPGHPGLQDFGECSLVGDNGASMYFRVDWLTPDGLRAWGDGRTFVLGTEGAIELRKYVDLAAPEPVRDVLLIADRDGERRMELAGEVGYPFFGRLIRDCLDGTQTAMTQDHTLKAAELCVRAQMAAEAAPAPIPATP